MSNSTDVYWDVDGTSLHQYAWSVATLGGDRNALPPMKGEDATFAYLEGQAWRAKTADARTMSLAMWILPRDVATDALSTDMRGRYTTNLRTLKMLFWKPRQQIALTRRWQEFGAGVTAATALAQVTGMEPTMTGPYRADLSVDLLLADPYFYTAQQTQSCAYGVGQAITNSGDDQTTGYGCEVVFNGPLTNPQLTNQQGVWLRLGTTVSGGDSITCNLYNNTAIRTSDGANMIGTVTHSGSRRWMVLQRGGNVLTLTGSSGSGTATMKWRAPYV